MGLYLCLGVAKYLDNILAYFRCLTLNLTVLLYIDIGMLVTPGFTEVKYRVNHKHNSKKELIELDVVAQNGNSSKQNVQHRKCQFQTIS